MPAAEYKRAPEVEEIAGDLIPEHHRHLMGVPIIYVFHDFAKTKKGNLVLASASKQSGIMAMLARNMMPTHDFGSPTDSEFFLLDFAYDAWCRLNEKQRIALVDHELCHCVIADGDENQSEKLATVGHDIEEFGAIVKRHSKWKPDLHVFAKMLEAGPQLSLDDINDPTGLNLGNTPSAEDPGYTSLTIIGGGQSVTLKPGDLERAGDRPRRGSRGRK